MTRKAPSGARHASCLDHIEYGTATKSGWLCISTNTENVAWPPLEIPRPDGGSEGPYIPRGTVGRDMQPVDRAADMRAFADHIAAVAAQHHAAELARRDIPNDPMGGYIATTDAKTGKAGRIPLAKQYGSPIAPRAADTAAILALAAELDARKGRAVKVVAPDTYVAAVKVAKARKVAPVKPEPVQVVVSGTVVAETRHVDIAPEPTPEPGQRNDAGEPDARGTAAAHDFGDLCDCGECVQPGTPDPVEPEPVRHLLYAGGRTFTYCAQPPTADSIAAPDHLGALSVLAAAGGWCEICIEYCARSLEPEPGQPEIVSDPATDAEMEAYAADAAELRAEILADARTAAFETRTRIGRRVARARKARAIRRPAAEPVQPEPCHYTAPPLNEACIAGPMGHKGAHEYPTVQPCDYYRHTVGVAPIRCTAGLVGHAGEHDYPAAVVAPEPIAEPIAPAAPVLAAVQPVQRPTCPRCGQVFRMKGAGLAWHLANRPDCAPARLSVAV